MAEFRMPALGADMESGTLVAWLVKPGDTVKRGDIVAEVETQKGIIEVEIFQSGVIERLLVEEGTSAPVGTPLAIVRVEGEPEPAAPPPTPPPAPPAGAVSPAAPAAPSDRWVAGPAGRVRISPAARKLAETLGVDPAAVQGTGPGGAVQIADIERAAAARAAQPAPPADPRAAMRRAIAAAMARSKREIPHYYLATEIDLTDTLAWLEQANAQRPVTERIVPAALLLKAVALAVRKVPEMNGFWRNDTFEPSPAVHPGVAIALRGGGLVAPAIHDVASLSLSEVMARLRDLVVRARAGRLRSSELSDPTITVTNLGEQGVTSVFGVIYPPQVALVGFGRINQRPWVVDGRVEPRAIVVASLSADHRASVGHRGGVFLSEIGRVLQAPEHL